ncbi:hypothetical protein HRD49_26710, partial [Corallococcus exiguus]|nr:hypothetical protein [Corallococcus exiguus]
MRMTRSGAVWLWLLLPVAAWAGDVPEVPRAGRGADEGFLQVEPTLILGAAEARWRLLGGKLYAMGMGGTLLSPTPQGTPRPGAFASVGLGVDHA